MRFITTESDLNSAYNGETLTIAPDLLPKLDEQRWTCSACATRVRAVWICASGRCAVCEARSRMAKGAPCV